MTGARKRRDTRVFDSEGREVFVTCTCHKCRRVKPLKAFGLRRMPDGKIRSIPWCIECRTAASPKHRGGRQLQLLAAGGA